MRRKWRRREDGMRWCFGDMGMLWRRNGCPGLRGMIGCILLVFIGRNRQRQRTWWFDGRFTASLADFIFMCLWIAGLLSCCDGKVMPYLPRRVSSSDTCIGEVFSGEKGYQTQNQSNVRHPTQPSFSYIHYVTLFVLLKMLFQLHHAGNVRYSLVIAPPGVPLA